MSTVVFVAITGGSGSGKSWLTQKLSQALAPDAAILSLDDFYRDLGHLPLGERACLNFDHPDAIDWVEFFNCLDLIGRGESVTIPKYDFSTHTRMGRRPWQPKPVVLLEGLLLLHHPEPRRLSGLTIYLECPERLRLERRIERDQAQRRRTRASILQQFRRDVAPMHKLYVEPQAKSADKVLGPEIAAGTIDVLVKEVRDLRRKLGI